MAQRVDIDPRPNCFEFKLAVLSQSNSLLSALYPGAFQPYIAPVWSLLMLESWSTRTEAHIWALGGGLL